MPREERLVAVAEVHRPRADHGGVGPGGAAVVAHAVDVRGHGGHLALGALGVHDVAHPLAEETGDVAVPRGRAGEDLGVAHPAQALVALRAVGRDLEEIAALAPVDVALELVDEAVAAGEGAGAGRVAVQHDAGDGVGQQGLGLGMAAELDVAEAVEREL